VSTTKSIDVTQRYAYFLQANNETAENLIPKKKHTHKKEASDDYRVVQARNEVHDAFKNFQRSETPHHEINLQRNKASFRAAYDAVIEEELTSEIHRLEELDNTKKHREARKAINSITGRKKGKTGKK